MDGQDCLDFLQRISTNDVLSVGQDRPVRTILTNEKGRLVDLVTVVKRGDGGVLLLGESEKSSLLQSWIEKYVIMEDIRCKDVTGSFVQLLVYGFEGSPRGPLFDSVTERFLIVDEMWRDCRMSRLLMDPSMKETAESELSRSGTQPSAWERYDEFRINHGIPASPSELSVSYNPLEAGLEDLISWTKGCYIGQEVIARLDTYKKVQKRLVRLNMEELPQNLPAMILSADTECGTITSARRSSDSGKVNGLGYLKTNMDLEGAGLFFFLSDGTKVPVIVGH